MKPLRNSKGKFSLDNLCDNIIETLENYGGYISYNKLCSVLHCNILKTPLAKLQQDDKIKLLCKNGYFKIYLISKKNYI